MIDLQIIDGLEMVDDMNRVFLDTETNDTVYLSDFDPELTADTAELMEENPSRFIPLPDQREINEYGMMEDFIDDLPDGGKKYTLAMSINGRGAFRRFKDTVRHYGLEEQWYAFREKCYARVARRWCEDNDVEYAPIQAAQPASADHPKTTDSTKEMTIAKLIELMQVPDDHNDRSSDLVLASMLKMIRALNQRVSREDLDRILADLEGTLQGD